MFERTLGTLEDKIKFAMDDLIELGYWRQIPLKELIQVVEAAQLVSTTADDSGQVHVPRYRRLRKQLDALDKKLRGGVEMKDYDDWLEDKFNHEKDDRWAALANGKIEPLNAKEKAFVKQLKERKVLER